MWYIKSQFRNRKSQLWNAKLVLTIVRYYKAQKMACGIFPPTFYYFKYGHNLPKQGNKFTDMKLTTEDSLC